MATNVRQKLSTVIDEVEEIAKRLRSDIRKAATASGLEGRIRKAARQLQKQAARAAAQVERYAHQLRVGIEGAGRKRSRRA